MKEKIIDYALGGTGVSSPLWAPHLTDVNETLTTASLAGGLLLLLTRLFISSPQVWETALTWLHKLKGLFNGNRN